MASGRAGADDRRHGRTHPRIAPSRSDRAPPGRLRITARITARVTPARRRLTRSADQRLLGGVAGGVAEYLGVDPVVVRVGFVVAAFFGGFGVIAYLLGWVVLPSAPATTVGASAGTDRRQLLGYALVALGLVAVGGRIGIGIDGDGAFWPLVLIGLGAAVLYLRARDSGDRPQPPPAPPSPPSSPYPPPAPTVVAPSPTTEELPTESMTQAAASATTPRAARPKSPLGAITWSSLLVLAGSAWLLEASGAIHIDVGVVVALGAGPGRRRAARQRVVRTCARPDRARHPARARGRRLGGRRRAARRRDRQPNPPTTLGRGRGAQLRAAGSAISRSTSATSTSRRPDVACTRSSASGSST